MGSAHDRACEIFAYIKGTRVWYGEEHSKAHDHKLHGANYEGRGGYEQWDSSHKIHLIGHSFGGNAARYLTYLLAIDFFGCGSTSGWIKSITTLSSPLQGSLLTYVLGADEEQNQNQPPVRWLSVGYNLGLFAHFWSLLSRNGSIPKYFGVDFNVGLEHFDLQKQGWSGFWKALKGGVNGGGTPAVCVRDNAAQDMTFTNASFINSLYHEHVKPDELYEFHFVATSNLTKNYNFKSSYKQHFKSKKGSSGYATLLCLRDYLTYHFYSKLRDRYHEDNLSEYSFVENHEAIEVHLGDSDGLCSAHTQFVGRSIEENSYSSCEEDFVLNFDPVKLKEMNFAPGTYCIHMKDYTHFSVVPFPDDFDKQTVFFDALFTTLRQL